MGASNSSRLCTSIIENLKSTNSYPKEFELSIDEYDALKREVEPMLQYKYDSHKDTFMGIPIVIKG